MSSSNNSVPPSVAARQHLDRLIQEEQQRRGTRFNLTDLHAFFYKRFIERRRPAEEEHDAGVASSSAQDRELADILEDAFPEFSLFGHIYTEIPDTDSDSSEEVYVADVAREAVPGEYTAVLPVAASTHVGPAAHGTAESVPTSAPAATEASTVNNPSVSGPVSEASEWLVCDPEEPADPNDTECYDSDQWEKMVMEIGNSVLEESVSEDNEGTTTSPCSLLQLKRQTFPHGEPDLSSNEPFPPYFEPFEGDAAQIHEEIAQAYSYALSKVADESNRWIDMSFRHPSLPPFANRPLPHPNTASPNVNPDFRARQGPAAWPRTPVRPRNASRVVPAGNTPSRGRYQAQTPQSKPTVVTHSMRSSEVIGHASSSSTSAQPNGPDSANKRLTQEAVRRGRVSSVDKKNMTFHAMTEMLLNTEINEDLRDKFSALSNDVLRLELDIFQSPEASAGDFLSPKAMELITPIAHAFIDYLGFLDQTLQKEAGDAQAVKAAVVQAAAADHNVSSEMRFRNMVRPILRNLKRPRPAEHRLLQTFVDLFDAYVYSDFLNIYNYQVIHDTVLYNERMAVSRLLISIWTILQRIVGNYKAITVVNDELKAQLIAPAMGTVANYKAIWDDENALYQQEVEGVLVVGE